MTVRATPLPQASNRSKLGWLGPRRRGALEVEGAGRGARNRRAVVPLNTALRGAPEEQPRQPTEKSELSLEEQPRQPTEKSELSVEGPEDAEPPPAWLQFRARGVPIVVALALFNTYLGFRMLYTVGITGGLGLMNVIVVWLWLWLCAAVQRVIFRSTPLPITMQELTLTTTFAGSLSGLVGASLLAMDYQTYLNLGVNTPGNRAEDVVELTYGVLAGFFLSTCFIGMFPFISLRKLFLVKMALPFPGSQAMGYLIKSLTEKRRPGDAASRRKIRTMSYALLGAFLWCLFKFMGSKDVPGRTCGLDKTPVFGWRLMAERSLSIDWAPLWIGVGMVCDHSVNWSLLVGSLVAWTAAWPALKQRAGDWFPAGLKDHDVQGYYGYAILISLAIFVTDGVYISLKAAGLLLRDHLRRRRQAQEAAPPNSAAAALPTHAGPPLDAKAAADLQVKEDMERSDRQDKELFLQSRFPWWFEWGGFLLTIVVATLALPKIFPQTPWPQTLVGAFLALIPAYGIAYAAGKTNWDVSSLYLKLAVFGFAAWTGAQNGGVIAGLVIGQVVHAVVNAPDSMIGSWKTALMTRTSPWAMWIGQAICFGLGALFIPGVFLFFARHNRIGDPKGPYPNPYSDLYRQLAILGTKGFSSLPRHSLQLAAAGVGGTILLDLLRDLIGRRADRARGPRGRRLWALLHTLFPSPMVMAIGFFNQATVPVAFDMMGGTVAKLAWEVFMPSSGSYMAQLMGAGLIAGDGLWGAIGVILTAFNKYGPWCLSFPGEPAP